MRLHVTRTYSAAHTLQGVSAKCGELHGHTWKVTLCINGGLRSGSDALIDFDLLKTIMDQYFPDHSYLNDWPALGGTEQPTAERTALALFRLLDSHISDMALNLYVYSVTVAESDTCSATAYREDTWAPEA